jgi:hypothetical protein
MAIHQEITYPRDEGVWAPSRSESAATYAVAPYDKAEPTPLVGGDLSPQATSGDASVAPALTDEAAYLDLLEATLATKAARSTLEALPGEWGPTPRSQAPRARYSVD